MSSRVRSWLRSLWRRAGTSPPGATGVDGDQGDDGAAVHEVTQSHDEVADYWTDERMREAKPRSQQRPLPGDE